MNIFITGATGFLGKSIVKSLIEKGHDISILVLPDEKVTGFENVQVKRGDITKKESLTAVCKGQDVVIHLAGAVGYGQHFSICEKINVEGTLNIAKDAIEQGVKRFIHMSSVAVYGRKDKVDISEDTAFLKIGDPYGDTKIDAEIALKELEKDLEITCIRPTVIYGPGDDKFLPKLMENLKSGKAKIIGDGKNRVDLIHVDDVVRFIDMILLEPRSYGEAYNLTNSKNLSWNEFMQMLSKEIGQSGKLGHLPYSMAYVVAALMEVISKITKKQPRLSRYAVRVVGKHYNFLTNKAKEQFGKSTNRQISS